jgi:ATP-dependent DNA helicase RecQ
LLKEIYVQLTQQNFLLQGFSGKFNMEIFHRRKKSFIAPSFGVNAYAGASEKKIELVHPVLYYQLKRLRDDICSKKNLPIYFIASSKTLEEMTTYLPQTLEELEQISGFGKSKVETYGNDFLSIIKEYSLENNLSSNITEKTPKRQRKETREPKVDTKEETLKLYQQGKTVNEIAKERNRTIQTIEGHLAFYVQNGLIKIDEVVSREKIVLIEPEARSFEGGSVASLKEKFGSKATWGEIRLVLAWVEYQKLSAHIDH